jgi:hypothetical protein
MVSDFWTSYHNHLQRQHHPTRQPQPIHSNQQCKTQPSCRWAPLAIYSNVRYLLAHLFPTTFLSSDACSRYCTVIISLYRIHHSGFNDERIACISLGNIFFSRFN